MTGQQQRDPSGSKVDARTKHFWRTLPPTSFLAVNRKEWEELHQRLNGGVPVPKERKKATHSYLFFFPLFSEDGKSSLGRGALQRVPEASLLHGSTSK